MYTMAENVSQLENMTGSTVINETVTVEFYSVFFNFGGIVLFAFPGILLNVSVLISTHCKKSVRDLQYGLHYSLFTLNIILCLVWAPLHTTHLYMNYSGYGAPLAVCYLSTALFHFYIASVIFLMTVLGVLHLHHLSSSPEKVVRSLVKRGIVASLFTAVLLGIATAIEFPYNVTYNVCTTGQASGVHLYKFWYSLLHTLLSIAYIAMLLVMMVLLWLALHAIRQRIHEMLEQARQSPQPLESIQENHEDTYEVSREEPSKHSSVTFKEPDIEETIPNKNGMSRTGKGIKFKDVEMHASANNNENTGDDDDEEGDDDAFDLKMRLRLQKTSSGRRHTVANIGLGDGLFGSKRRGSLDVQRSPTTPQGYNYIRKWSVDITALQNQLENPKLHTGSYPFRDLGILPEKEQSPTEEHPVQEENEDDAENEDESDETTASLAHTAPQISFSDEEHKTSSDFKEPSSTAEVPSIVVDESAEDSLWQDDHFGGQQDNEENNHIDEEIVRRFHKQLKKSKRFILFFLLTLLSLLLCLLAMILQGTVTAHFGVNLVYVTSPLCLIACLLQPLLLVWIDIRLSQAVKRMWNKMTHWKCICYCNIGKGKKFFAKPPEIEEKNCDM